MDAILQRNLEIIKTISLKTLERLMKKQGINYSVLNGAIELTKDLTAKGFSAAVRHGRIINRDQAGNSAFVSHCWVEVWLLNRTVYVDITAHRFRTLFYAIRDKNFAQSENIYIGPHPVFINA